MHQLTWDIQTDRYAETDRLSVGNKPHPEVFLAPPRAAPNWNQESSAIHLLLPLPPPLFGLHYGTGNGKNQREIEAMRPSALMLILAAAACFGATAGFTYKSKASASATTAKRSHHPVPVLLLARSTNDFDDDTDGDAFFKPWSPDDDQVEVSESDKRLFLLFIMTPFLVQVVVFAWAFLSDQL